MFIEIFEHGTFKGYVESQSPLCVKQHPHIATSLQGDKFVHTHIQGVHTMLEGEKCDSPITISNETSLFKFLYNSKCPSGKLATDISIGSVFNQSHTGPYPTISSEKILDGSYCTIKPSSTFTHGASSEMYLFKTGSSLTLHNLTVSGFTSDSSLTIIDSTGPYLGIAGCIFNNNKVYQHIFVEDFNNVTDICNSLFQDVTSSRAGFGGGGAITSLGKTISISDSSFISNSSSSDGGALYATNIVLNGSSYFNNNTAYTLGGGIYAKGSLIIDTSDITFSSNAATDGSNIYIENFNRQTSFITSDASFQSGGVSPPILYASRAMLIDNSSALKDFITNDSSHVGVIRQDIFNIFPTELSLNVNKTFYGSVQKGQKQVLSWMDSTSDPAVFYYPLINSNSGDVHLYNLDVSGFVNIKQSADYNGSHSAVAWTGNGDIHIHSCDIHDNSGKWSTISSYKNIMLTGSSSFSNNHVAGNGGALYAASGDILLEGTSTFEHNTAGKSGGALYANYGAIRLDGSFSFVDNSAGYGGALYTENSGISLLKGPYEFSGNRATDGEGGAIASHNGITISADIGTSTFTQNYAKTHGGALHAIGPITLGGNPTFTGNHAMYNGGAINAVSGLVISNLKATFINNQAKYGGAIHASGDASITTSTLNFYDNSATLGGGGAINTTTGKLAISDSSLIFNRNDASYGGAIYGLQVSLTNVSGSFTNNKSFSSYGGAINGTNGVTLDGGNIDFCGNTAAIGGGAIYSDPSGTLNISGGNHTFTGNHATYNGGAIDAVSGLVISHKVHSTFINNQAKYGGAIHASGDASITTSTLNFYDNSATLGGGGAINTTTGKLAISDSSLIFNRNDASYGGAIYGLQVSLTNVSGSFTNNKSFSSYGGAINGTNGVTLDGGNIDFCGNTAAIGGGALYAEDADITLTNNSTSTFTNNSAAGAGGALYALSGDILLDGTSTFTNNHADGSGGALYAATGTIRLDGSFSFVDNSAGYGGALYTENSGISLLKGPYEFSGNRATDGEGGAIASHNGITISADIGTPTPAPKFACVNGVCTAGDAGSISLADCMALCRLTSPETPKPTPKPVPKPTTKPTSTFTNNYADSSGGALYAATGAIVLNGSFSFVDNSAGFGGGALYTETSGISLSKGHYEFSGNYAPSGEHIWAKTDICYNGLVKKLVTFTDPCCQDGVWVGNSLSMKCLKTPK